MKKKRKRTHTHTHTRIEKEFLLFFSTKEPCLLLNRNETKKNISIYMYKNI